MPDDPKSNIDKVMGPVKVVEPITIWAHLCDGKGRPKDVVVRSDKGNNWDAIARRKKWPLYLTSLQYCPWCGERLEIT